jgi:hypothetical protein
MKFIPTQQYYHQFRRTINAFFFHQSLVSSLQHILHFNLTLFTYKILSLTKFDYRLHKNYQGFDQEISQ